MANLGTALTTLEHLVSFDTTSRNSNLALIEWVEASLAETSTSLRRIASTDGTRSNLVATIGPDLPGGVILSGHSDVVPVDGQEWQSDPWKLQQRGEKLFGRGTADMKTFLALAITCAPEFARGGRPVHLAISYDEEVGCLGAPPMIARIRSEIPTPQLAIVGEPTLMRIIDAHKGSATYEIRVTGHEMHSSLVDSGVSANMVAVELMHALNRLADELREKADPDNGFDPPQATLTIRIMNGGTAANILAREARILFDLRCPPGMEPDAELDGFKALCRAWDLRLKARFADAGVTIERKSCIPALATSHDPSAAEFVRRLTGDNAPVTRASYAAEAGQFQQAGFPVVLCGPGSIEQAHQPDEWIAAEQVERGLSFMHRLVAELR